MEREGRVAQAVLSHQCRGNSFLETQEIRLLFTPGYVGSICVVQAAVALSE